jgi:V-type H+-transporting ATPase proteolipid subunit
MSSVFSGDETAPFFGFLGAAAALVFSCTILFHLFEKFV